jgi:hypothetical protein
MELTYSGDTTNDTMGFNVTAGKLLGGYILENVNGTTYKLLTAAIGIPAGSFTIPSIIMTSLYLYEQLGRAAHHVSNDAHCGCEMNSVKIRM